MIQREGVLRPGTRSGHLPRPLHPVLFLLALVLSFIGQARAQDAQYSAEEVKATFLYHFAAYTRWPKAKPPHVRITIGVTGAPAVANELRRILPGHMIRNRTPVLREVDGPEDLAGLDMLYVGPREADDLRDWVAASADFPVMVVADSPKGLDDGAVINFLLVGRRVQFEVSLTAAERHGFGISSRLLSVALRVRKGKLEQEFLYALRELPQRHGHFVRRGREASLRAVSGGGVPTGYQGAMPLPPEVAAAGAGFKIGC